MGKGEEGKEESVTFLCIGASLPYLHFSPPASAFPLLSFPFALFTC